MFHTLLLRSTRLHRSVPYTREYNTSVCTRSLLLNHRVPVERITALTKEQRKEAKGLVQEDPLQWTPTNLANRFRVSTNLIQATVPAPPKRILKLRRQLAQEIRPRAVTPRREKLDAWIQTQINKTPEFRAKKTNWRKKGNYELKDNIDAIERKLAKLQEISLKAMNEAKKARKEK